MTGVDAHARRHPGLVVERQDAGMIIREIEFEFQMMEARPAFCCTWL
jgi:hypothetical protein